MIAHREIERANRDWETFSVFDGTTLAPLPPERRGVMLVTKDPPDHSRIRRLISAGFTPRMVGRLEEQIQAGPIGSSMMPPPTGVPRLRPRDRRTNSPMHVIGDIVGIPELTGPRSFALTDTILRAMDPFQEITPAERPRRAEVGSVHLRATP